jgi:hypothetical protein
MRAWLIVALVALAACKDKGKATDAMQRKLPMKAPEDSDCARKSGKCVAREEQRDCKDSFYSHACADLGSDQPICCVFAQ